jgi:hypothetical protein
MKIEFNPDLNFVRFLVIAIMILLGTQMDDIMILVGL